MAGYRDQCYLGDIKYERETGNRTGGRFKMEVDIPGIRGELSAARIGQMFAGEMIDKMRSNWRAGRTADGRPAHELSGRNSIKKLNGLLAWQEEAIRDPGTSIKKYKERISSLRRSRRNAVRSLKRAKTDKSSSGAQGRIDEIDKKITSLQARIKIVRGYARATSKKYRSRRANRSRTVITGMLTQPYQSGGQYTPHPSTPRYNHSGLMADSLRGRYYPERRYTTPDGKQVTVRSNVRITVSKLRTMVAQKAGFSQGSPYLSAWRSGGFKTGFPGTAALIDSGLYWSNARGRLRAIVQGLRTIEKMTNYMGTMV